MPRRSRLGLILASAVLLASLTSAASPQEPAGFLGAFRWRMAEAEFGGFSAIEVLEGGSRFVAVTDRGAWTQGAITRDDEGRITGIEAEAMRPLRGTDGQPLTRGMADSEGVAIAADGTTYVSFEGTARVMRYATLDQPGTVLPLAPAFARLPRNGALEALAVDGAGRIHTVPEGPFHRAQAVNLFRFAEGTWEAPWQLPASQDFLPVAADFGPDGRLYVLQRGFHGLAGFSARVLRFDLAQTGLLQPEVLLETAPGTHDNLEGMAVWRDATGAIRLTMISDDNFMILQRTEIVEYRLAD